MPTLTGTLLADAHDLEVLANTTPLNLPFESFYIAEATIGIPVSDISPTDPRYWVRGGERWGAVAGRPTTSVRGGEWPDMRVR